MRRLHPEGPDATVDYAPGTLEFSSKSIEAAIKSFPCGSSGGISGWRASRFKAMLRSEERMALLNALANFTNAVANGHFTPKCMKVITAARLVAVPKPLGGFRHRRRRFSPKGGGQMPFEVGSRLHSLIRVAFASRRAGAKRGRKSRPKSSSVDGAGQTRRSDLAS